MQLLSVMKIGRIETNVVLTRTPRKPEGEASMKVTGHENWMLARTLAGSQFLLECCERVCDAGIMMMNSVSQGSLGCD